MNSDTPAARLAVVRDHMRKVCLEHGRDPASATLVAVSKTFPAEAIRPVLEVGQRHFGENRVQESQAKWPGLKADFPDVTLHLIGPLQSNKAEDAVALFDVIHTIDRPKIAAALAAAIAKSGRTPELLIEVNTGEEPQKAGILPHETAAFLGHCRGLGLAISGLMCIPPVDEEPAVHFALLGKLARELGLSKLSMGMSADYETALQFNATYIRVGSAIFGHRT